MDTHVERNSRASASLSEVVNNSGNFTAGSMLVGNNVSARGNVYMGCQNVADSELLQRQALRQALYYQTMDRKKALLDSKKKACLDWVWSTEIATWLSDGNGVFWVCGKPGSGKSTLMNWLAQSDKVKNALPKKSRWIIMEFYFNFEAESELANRPEGMLRSFLLQLIEHESFDRCIREQHQDPNYNWVKNQEEMMRTITQALQACNYRLCAFVDGLDEYTGKIKTLADCLLDLQARTNMKLIVASRPDSMLAQLLKSFPVIHVQRHNEPTIRHYIKEASKILDSEGVSELASIWEDVISRADGVVLWTTFVVDELIEHWIDGATKAELQEILESYPQELQKVYNRLMSKIAKDQEVLATIALFIVDANGSMHTSDLFVSCLALAEEVDACFRTDESFSPARFEARMKKVLGGLLEFDHPTESRNFTWMNTGKRVQTHQGDEFYLSEQHNTGHNVQLIHRTLSSHLKHHNRLTSVLQDRITPFAPDLSQFPLDLIVIRQADRSETFPVDIFCEFSYLQFRAESQRGTQRSLQSGPWRYRIPGVHRSFVRLLRGCSQKSKPQKSKPQDTLDLFKLRIFRQHAMLHRRARDSSNRAGVQRGRCRDFGVQSCHGLCYLQSIARQGHWAALQLGIKEVKQQNCAAATDAAISHIVELLVGNGGYLQKQFSDALDELLDGVALKVHHLTIYFLCNFYNEPRFIQRARKELPEVFLQTIDPCPWYHHQSTNLLFCWALYTKDLSEGCLIRIAGSLKLLLDLGLDINAEVYEHGTVLHALFQSTDLVDRCFELSLSRAMVVGFQFPLAFSINPRSSTACDMTKFELISMSGYNFAPISRFDSILNFARASRDRNAQRWDYGLHSIVSTIDEILVPFYNDFKTRSDKHGVSSGNARRTSMEEDKDPTRGSEDQAQEDKVLWTKQAKQIKAARIHLWTLWGPSGCLPLIQRKDTRP